MKAIHNPVRRKIHLVVVVNEPDKNTNWKQFTTGYTGAVTGSKLSMNPIKIQIESNSQPIKNRSMVIKVVNEPDKNTNWKQFTTIVHNEKAWIKLSMNPIKIQIESNSQHKYDVRAAKISCQWTR